MFEKFTKSALESIVLSQKIASLQKTVEAEPEHLLISLAALDQSSVKQQLCQAGMSSEKIEAAVKVDLAEVHLKSLQELLSASNSAPLKEIPFSKASIGIFDRAEKLRDDHNQVGVGNEHLLLAVFQLEKELTCKWLGEEKSDAIEGTIKQNLECSKALQ
ncbi:MAG: hypothetical protein J0M35_02825 [Candidatus Obscuribacter phosphatis]|uniref:Clp R domain-containing protein n=1 Tax=Candidatus Obscuribacter phosphatis TaxID=1906157 RepID=A0A8J7P702_9BACT|nr:hypothetical protein [Candidatus Obscuribacter phosphatis]